MLYEYVNRTSLIVLVCKNQSKFFLIGCPFKNLQSLEFSLQNYLMYHNYWTISEIVHCTVFSMYIIVCCLVLLQLRTNIFEWKCKCLETLQPYIPKFVSMVLTSSSFDRDPLSIFLDSLLNLMVRLTVSFVICSISSRNCLNLSSSADLATDSKLAAIFFPNWSFSIFSSINRSRSSRRNMILDNILSLNSL